MKDKIKQFGNLKPKQKFILIGDDSPKESAELVKNALTANGDKDGEAKSEPSLIIDELSAKGNLKKQAPLNKEELDDN